VLSARKECLAEFATEMRSAQLYRQTILGAYSSISFLTRLRTKGRGLIVSRFPRGIWRTKLIELEIEVTMRDPLSTLRRSHRAVSTTSVSSEESTSPRARKGAYKDS